MVHRSQFGLKYYNKTQDYMENNDLKKIVTLSKKFISIESVAKNQKELDHILTLALSEVKDFNIKLFEKNGVKSALIFNKETLPKRFKVILNGHLDVTPGKKTSIPPKFKTIDFMELEHWT